jgi:AmmeMemoRadiSam system protein B
MILDMLDAVRLEAAPPKAIVAPHAGYVYSGSVAATAYAQLRPVREEVKRVVLIGPSHRVYFEGIAASSAGAYATPLGDVAIDAAAVNDLLVLEQVSVLDAAHAHEHSLEVHVPFLQACLGEFLLVPLVVGEASAAEVAEVLARADHGPDTLIVVSSDLSHFLDYAGAVRTDAETSRRIEALRDDIRPEEACGCRPLNGLLRLARSRGMRITPVDVRNSGDTAGTRDRVVGYGSYLSR